MPTDLFSNNVFILLLIFAISVFLVDKLNERQKIAIIYICAYGMAFTEMISEKILLPSLAIILFLMQEFFTSDRKKLSILKKIHYKITDFLYMGIFQYKIWLVYVSICIRTTYIKECLTCPELLLDLVSLILFGIAINWMFNLTEEFYSFSDMYNIIWKTPYYNVTFDTELQHRLNIIALFEDHLYWERSKSYSVVSLDYIKAWFNERRKANSFSKKSTKHHGIKFKKIITLFGRLFRYISNFFTRGHSTIPMQLIRILSYRHGLVFGTTKIKYKNYKIFKRKIYEVLYSRMFFEGLRNYLSIELCNNMTDYRKYLVYLYPQIVQTTIDGHTFAPANKAFSLKDNKIPPMNIWDMDQVIRMSFGFNGLAITEKRMAEKREALKPYGFSANEVQDNFPKRQGN